MKNMIEGNKLEQIALVMFGLLVVFFMNFVQENFYFMILTSPISFAELLRIIKSLLPRKILIKLIKTNILEIF